MTKLFIIEQFSFSNSGSMICVTTNKGQQFINKEKFQKWVDDRDKRRCECGCNKLVDWFTYYNAYADDDIYDYLVIRGGSSLLLGIEEAIKKCLN